MVNEFYFGMIVGEYAALWE